LASLWLIESLFYAYDEDMIARAQKLPIHKVGREMLDKLMKARKEEREGNVR
jgi:hypothetical protein